ncbi:hypothetical protein PCASD_10743 [Puccinia coronata f. sp. avenae]|uniref:Uncharacterized protein n=1 Tax=Puccinia coronata f. sp. avenae TaxID=200324 RepID=A0A2N5UT03_9BASI|nr:hypothetical protein PCASD_10743 [Puccinia coronata f. sp. avenae]
MATPTLDEVKAMDLSDHFWNMGALTHPDEPWAINVSIQKGISEYLTVIHCKEELSRIAREAQQAVKWAISRQTRLQEILELFNNEHEAPRGSTFIVDLCSKHNLQTSVLESVYANLSKNHCQLLMAWNSHCSQLLEWTQRYRPSQEADEINISERWNKAINDCKNIWENQTNASSVIMEYADQEEYEEEDMLEQEELGNLNENDENLQGIVDEDDELE